MPGNVEHIDSLSCLLLWSGAPKSGWRLTSKLYQPFIDRRLICLARDPALVPFQFSFLAVGAQPGRAFGAPERTVLISLMVRLKVAAFDSVYLHLSMIRRTSLRVAKAGSLQEHYLFLRRRHFAPSAQELFRRLQDRRGGWMAGG